MYVYAFIYISFLRILQYMNTNKKREKKTSHPNINVPSNRQIWKSKNDKHI